MTLGKITTLYPHRLAKATITTQQENNMPEKTKAEIGSRTAAAGIRNNKSTYWIVFLLWMGLLLTTPRLSSAGTALGDLAASMEPGTWAELTTLSISVALTDPVTGGVGHILPYAEGMRWDPVTRKVYLINSDDPGDGRRFVVYSELTNAWIVLPDPWTGTGVAHQYDGTDIDVTHRVLYTVMPDGDNGRKYNLDTGLFTNMPAFPNMPYSCCEASVYFPEMNGLILLNNGDLYKLSDSTNQWSTVATGFNTSYHSFAEYNPMHKVVVFGGGNNTSKNFYKLNSAGQVTTLGMPPIGLEVPRMEFVYDPASGLYLVFDNKQHFYTYNVLTDTWTPQSIAEVPSAIWATSDPNQFNTVVAPISTYGVLMFTNCQNSTCRVYLYKHAQGNNDTAPPATPTGLQVR